MRNKNWLDKCLTSGYRAQNSAQMGAAGSVNEATCRPYFLLVRGAV